MAQNYMASRISNYNKKFVSDYEGLCDSNVLLKPEPKTTSSTN